MLVLKYLLEILGAGLITGAAVSRDLRHLRRHTIPPPAKPEPHHGERNRARRAFARRYRGHHRLHRRGTACRSTPFRAIRWGLAQRLVISGVAPLLLAPASS